MKTLIRNAAAIVTVNTNGKNMKRGAEQNEAGVLYDHSVVFENDIIKDIIPSSSDYKADEIIDARDKTVLPGFIESHTHLVFAGSSR
jgi:imidazolonepropionase